MVESNVKDAELAAKTAEVLFENKDTKSNFKDYAVRFFGALFMERKRGKWIVSVGRFSWWMAFMPALYIWIQSGGKQDITAHHVSVLLLLAGYNFGKKVVDRLKNNGNENDGPG